MLALGGSAWLTALCLARPKPAQAAVRRAVPSRGFNLPDWLSRDDGVAPAQDVLAALRQLGFETIRLPVNGDLISTDSISTLRRIHAGVTMLVRLGFNVIVDMHPSTSLHEALRDNPHSGGQRVIRAWQLLREAIADLPPESVFPELLNEPPMERTAWLPLRNQLADIVRSRCPSHALVWGPAPTQGIWEIVEMPPLTDGNQIAAVHFYGPMAFTHQCANWDISALARIAGLPFPASIEMPRVQARIAALRAAGDEQASARIEDELSTPWTEAAITSEFEKLHSWSETHDCPVMLNEFGVLNFCVDAESRLSWVRAVRRAAEAYRVGWAYWELDQGFGFVESRQRMDGFDQAMIAALLDGKDGG